MNQRPEPKNIKNINLEVLPSFKNHHPSLIAAISQFESVISALIDTSSGTGTRLGVLRIGELELSQTEPDLDVVGLSQEAVVKTARPIVLLLLNLEVDVGLPEDLGHVEKWLFDA